MTAEVLAPQHDLTVPETAGQVAELLTGELLTADLLIEDVSIDGMCGVY